jgi:hypothetical protein
MIGEATRAFALTTRPELLAPAGDYDALVAAVNNGADASISVWKR